MQNEKDVFPRRHFLQWSAASLAAAAAPALISTKTTAQEASPGALSERRAPAHRLLLRSAEMEVAIDPENGLPWEYRLLKTNARLRGEESQDQTTVTICRHQPWSFATTPLLPESHSASANSAIFRYAAKFGQDAAATFAIRYRLNGATLTVTMEEVREMPGFELIEFSMPRLVSVREADQGAWLAHGDSGGSLALLSEAKAGSLPPNRFWGKVLGTLPVVMVGTAQAMCIQETTAFMDGTTLAVDGDSGSRRAGMGTIKVHRVNGSACYDLNLLRGAPLNCGNQNTPNLLVEQASSCRLDFLPVTGDPAKAWITAGKLVRSRMPEIPTHFYDDKYVYGIHCDAPDNPQTATFEQCREIIDRVAALTDKAPQVVHLWGWQFRGKDTGYPAVNVVDERIGGYEGMMRLMEHGPEVNAVVTLSDNYDDAYRSSPAWNEAYIARRPDGQLWKSRPWTGEESYIQGLAKYMAGPGPDRVRYTCERYKLKHTTHVDVLSYYAIRNDWDPEHPASGIRNLLDGRYKVLEGFKAHGVDVSSEALRYPMIGHISCYWYLTGPDPCPFGGTAIPLVPLVYGKSAIWGLSGPGARGDADTVRIQQRFYGACPHGTTRYAADPSVLLDAWYLGMVPFFLLRGRSVEDFEREGDTTRIHLEDGALIESNLPAKTIRVALNGRDVLRDDAVFCPVVVAGAPAEKIACYSITPRSVTVPLPEGWNASEVMAAALYADRREKLATTPGEQSVTLRLAARQPVMLYRSAAGARLT